mmetsp:Transcript_57923/g.109110  ORF Transcript_57923/g.109110 Transcript_57923/m.109110 type:complete len:82 (+) Transcript_57923:117-362(+)
MEMASVMMKELELEVELESLFGVQSEMASLGSSAPMWAEVMVVYLDQASDAELESAMAGKLAQLWESVKLGGVSVMTLAMG